MSMLQIIRKPPSQLSKRTIAICAIAALVVIGILVAVLAQRSSKDPAAQSTASNSSSPQGTGPQQASADKGAASTKPGNNKQASNSAANNNPSTQQTFSSKQNPFSLKYPNDWQVIPDAQTGSEEQVTFASKVNDGQNVFQLAVSVSTDQDSRYQPRAIQNGQTSKAQNSLEFWEQNKVRSLREGPPQMYCPNIQLVSKDDTAVYHFSYRMSNGKYLTVYGSFCPTERSAPSLTYEQQLGSREWAIAKDIIGSLQSR